TKRRNTRLIDTTSEDQLLKLKKIASGSGTFQTSKSWCAMSAVRGKGDESRGDHLTSAGLARISHSVEAHRGANQRKLLCSNDFSLIQGAPRCRQSVAQNDLILEWWKAGLWKRPLMAGW